MKSPSRGTPPSRKAKPASVRVSFVKKFGEDQAKAIEAAAEEHATSTNGSKRGDDPFKWAILIAIGYQCAEKPHYREHHGITAQWKDIKSWIKRHAELHSHVGDCDFLCMLGGGYNEYMPKERKAA